MIIFQRIIWSLITSQKVYSLHFLKTANELENKDIQATVG